MYNYEVTFNYGSKVCQHNFMSELDQADFLMLMSEEWMIDPNDGDAITITLLAAT